MLFPALKWIKFLRNYGPISTNGNLFDEHVNAALRHAKVQPITLPTPYVTEMINIIKSGSSSSLLIAGTAGDGKTFHCRQLWLNLGGTTEEWASVATIKHLKLADGRSIVFVKDLSELNAQDGDNVLDGLNRSVLESDDSTLYVIATNHGQILDRLRKREGHHDTPSPLHQHIQNVFLQTSIEHERLRIFDLSRSVHRQSFNEVLAAVVEHPEWERCESCEIHSGERVCPIFENRMRILGLTDGQLFRHRLGDLIEIASLNGAHLPIRDLLALTANMLLGHPDAKEGLMTCNDIPLIQENGRVGLGSIYRNVFASNLRTGRSAHRAASLPVFKVLASFGIGFETTNGVDGILVYGSDDARLKDDFESLIGNDQVYGATPEYIAFQRQYLEGDENARLDDGADPFLARLIDQRQRLFFSLPKDLYDRYPYWELTAFRFAGDYLTLLESIMPDGNRRLVDDRTRSLLVKGLNRTMTGLLLDNPDTVFIANSGGFTQSKISVLCDNAVPGRYDKNRGTGMSIRWDKKTQSPCLFISVGRGRKGEVCFELSPIRFEFLCRVAEGALPSSFSNECFEDLLAFKARLLRQSELVRLQRISQREEENDLEVDEEHIGLTLSFIEIENNGHGFLKQISVRNSQ
jgi:broad-specificity NMP kinase